MVGGNDLAQETDEDGSNLLAVIAQTVAEVQEIVDVVTDHTNADGSHPQIIVSALIPNRVSGGWGSAVVAFYNSSLESNPTGVDLWITDNWDDLYDPATGQAQVSLMSDDVHPNADGYAVIAENWLEAINSLLHHLYLPLILCNH
jgi:lysophospholipase L1-like esterase